MAGARNAIVVVASLIVLILHTGTARADPLPPFDLDPAKLEARMNACLAGEVGDQEVLFGWWNLSTGQERHWRCSSLRHMMWDRDDRPPHDPYVDVASFMICADEVVTHGFPRPGDPGNTVLIYQYNGTRDRAVAAVNDTTGDVITIYTTTSNDWAGCARSLQW